MPGSPARVTRGAACSTLHILGSEPIAPAEELAHDCGTKDTSSSNASPSRPVPAVAALALAPSLANDYGLDELEYGARLVRKARISPYSFSRHSPRCPDCFLMVACFMVFGSVSVTLIKS